jgi:glycosyltransferase involved in cell wall biosynthesis
VSAVRLLVLAPFPPRLDATHGGSRAIAELLVRLAPRHRIALLCARRDGEPGPDDELAAACDRIEQVTSERGNGTRDDLRVGLGLLGGTPMWVSRERVPDMERRIRETARDWRPDVVQLEYHLMGQYLDGLDGCPAPRVLRQLEPATVAAAGRMSRRRGLKRLAGHLDLSAWRRYERRVMTRVQTVVALTDRDAAAMAPLAGTTPIARIPLGVPIPARAADPFGSAEAELLFVGNFVHPPNCDAAERLVGAIFPRVLTQCPQAVLRIVGPNPPASLAGRSGAGITIEGEVASVAPFLERAAVFVAPLRQGGGMRVKVAEALAAGKAVVASRLAVEGMAVDGGEELLLAESDEDVAAAAVRLLRDRDLRGSLARRARRWAEANLGWEAPVAAFERLYANLLLAVRSGPPA